MYIPTAFAETRLDVLHPFMRANGFVTLVTHSPTGLIASHIPILLHENRGPRGTLAGHLAIQNDHWRALETAAETLAIFQGPHAYISPSWYTNPLNVPTWNYAVVHAYGKPRIIQGPALRAHLQSLVAHYESIFPVPWQMQSLPENFIEKLEKAIVGFELEIDRLEGKWKMGQNRTPEDRHSAAEFLAKSDDPVAVAVAKLMTPAPAKS